MMKVKYYLTIATAAALFAACTNDENEVNNAPVEARVTAGMGNATRAVNTDNTWTADDAIGVMVASAPTSGTGMTDRYKNVKYTTAAGGSTASFTAETGKGIFFQDANETVTFAAYYPYQSTADNATLPGTSGIITVNTNGNNTAANQASIDFLFAQGATASKSSPTVAFQDNSTGGGADCRFKHKMAQLNLVIKASTDDGFTQAEANGIFSDVAGTYKLSGLVHEGSFDVTDGITVVTGSGVDGWDITGCVHTDVANTSRTYTLILLPQDKSGSPLTFTALIGGQTYTNNTSIAPDLQPETTYTYTITVKKTGLTVSGCEIAPWTTTTGVTGDASM